MAESQSKDIVDVKNVSKSFGGPLVLERCNFKIRNNSIMAIVGPNGSGKTTLFNIISGFIKPDKGIVYIDGKNIEKLSVNQISNLGISRIFQQSTFFPNLTIIQNLTLSIDNENSMVSKNILNINESKEKIKIIRSMLKLFNLKIDLQKFPQELSFGQQRIIEIVRALIKPHKIIVMDEPLAGLSIHMKTKMKNIILKLRKNHETLLIAEHDIDFVSKVADRIILLEKGRLIMNTSPKKVLKSSVFSKTYLGE